MTAVNVTIKWERAGGGTTPGDTAPVITSPAFLVAGTVGSVYPTTTFTASGTAPITWSYTGTLPAGMAFSSAGVLSGTPTATASGSIQFTATNAYGSANVSLALTVNAASVVANTMSLSLPTGTATNYPYQFGRVFKQGVIANYPQVLIDGVAQTTQADVKNRWPDGSVKFAVLSLVVPSLSTSAKTFTFQNQASGNNTPETKANMLASYDFNCTINATSGGSPITGAPVSARTILNAVSDATLASNSSAHSPDSRYWTQGPICTTVILCDHTTKTYDFGTDSIKSLRPIFHVQFWPTIGRYKVRVIVEQSDTTKLQNQAYDVSITRDNASPVQVYAKSSVSHTYATRWTKEFWSGNQVTNANEIHNIGYLASTYAIQNYDAAITVNPAALQALKTSWTSAQKDIYGAGLWQKEMSTVGGRSDIGPMTSWTVYALYSGDNEILSIAKSQCDLAAAWQSHFRTGEARVYNSLDIDNSAIGRPPNRDAFPTQFTGDGNQYINNSSTGVLSADRWSCGASYDLTSTIQGAITLNGWKNDQAHCPDPSYGIYLITGDYWYLEQLQMWASLGVFCSNPNDQNWGSGRSPGDAIIQGETRAYAWTLRNRARAGFISVDGSPEKIYLSRATETALRAFEGRYIGAGSAGLAPTTSGRGDAVRNWWASNDTRFSGNPLRYWEFGDTASPAGIDTTICALGGAYWMYNHLVSALSVTKELGYSSSELLSWAAQSLIGTINSAGDIRYMAASYNYPIRKATPANTFFQTWSDARAAYRPIGDPSGGFIASWDQGSPQEVGDGRGPIISPALAGIASEPGGLAAWNTYYSESYFPMFVNATPEYNWAYNPKLAIKPR